MFRLTPINLHPRHRRTLTLILGAAVVFAPFAAVRSAPTARGISNLGLLSVGGTVTASSTSTLTPDQAFDGKFYALSKASPYENGWTARGGVGSWIERRWPGPIILSGITLTRRSNRTIGLCNKAKDVDVSLGGGPVQAIRLADTNAPQHFALTSNSVRLVRVTVRSTEGTNCTNGAVGFAEIEIYGVPRNWTPNITPAPALAPPAADVPANALTFVYDTSIPADAQAYLAGLFDAVLPVLTEVLGPPLASQTLTVRLNPFYGSFTYAAALSTLTISRLPNSALPPSDPANWDFDANVVHELAHAYQYGYGSTAPAWFREGFAQASTDLVKQVLAERGTPMLQNTTIDEGEALRTYDAMAAMGPEVLSSLWYDNGRFIPYTNAEGLWWLLLLSQSSPRVNGSFAELDFLKRVEATLYAQHPGDGDAERRAFLASLSPNPIDGLPAAQWLSRQPVVYDASYVPAFGFYPSDCICPDANAASAQHLIVSFRYFGTPMNGVPVNIVLRDAVGTVLVDETKTYTDYGFGFFYYTFPILIDLLPPGRYDVTAEATLNGVVLRATQSLARGSYVRMSADGLGIARRLADPANPLALTSSVGAYTAIGAENGKLENLAGLPPQELSLTVNGRGARDTVFLPAPYARFVNLP